MRCYSRIRLKWQIGEFSKKLRKLTITVLKGHYFISWPRSEIPIRRNDRVIMVLKNSFPFRHGYRRWNFKILRTICSNKHAGKKKLMTEKTEKLKHNFLPQVAGMDKSNTRIRGPKDEDDRYIYSTLCTEYIPDSIRGYEGIYIG